MTNIWSKKFNKTNKNTYELSKELNIPEEKIKEVIKGERQVPTNDVDRVNGAFVSNSIGISSFERAMMEKFFMDNDIQDLKRKFGYKTLRELSGAMGIGIATMYYFRGDKIKAISDKLLKKAYDFFQDDWNKKVNKKEKINKSLSKTWYYQMPISELSQDVINWYNTTDLKALLKKEGIKANELLKKLGFNENYSAIYYKYAKGTINNCTSNWLLVQQLYNYYHGLELMNTTAKSKDELYGNINTPAFENYTQSNEHIEILDIEPKERVSTEQKIEDNTNTLDNSELVEENKKMEVVEPINTSSAIFVEYEEYKKVVDELERYKFLIDKLMKLENN